MKTDFRVILRRLPAQIDDTVCRQVSIPKFMIPIVIAHLMWLEKNWLWHGTQEQIDFVKNSVDKLIYGLAYGDCEGKPGEKPPDTVIIRKSTRQNQIILWEMIESMFDFDIEDHIRVRDGKLQINVDNCDGCDWTTIWDFNGNNAQKTYDNILDEAGKLIDDAFSELGGFDTPTNIPNKDNDLKRCAKATGFALLLWEYLNTLVDTWDTVTPDYGDSQFNLSSFANGVISGIAGVLGISPLLIPVLGVAEIGAIVLKTNNDAIDELRGVLDDNANRQKFTCFLYKHMTTRDRLVGEDVANIIEAINAGGLAFSVTVRSLIVDLIRALPITKTSDFVDMQRVSNDCGCPDVIAAVDPNSVIPELATWAVKANFKAQTPSFYGFTVDYGDYVPNKGLDGSYDAGMTRNFAFISKGLGGNTMLERVDIALANVVKGQFWSGNTPDNDIEGFYLRHRFVGGNPIAVVPIKTPITQKTIGLKATELTLQFMFGYREEDPNTIPDQTGFGTIESVTVWGRGAIPNEYSAWEQVYGS